MINSIPAKVLPFTLALAVIPFVAFAQTPSADAPFEEVRGRLKPGQVAEVVDNSGLTVRGKVTEISSSRITLTGGSGTKTFTSADVRVIRRTGPIWDGAVKGAIIGAVPWLFIAHDCYDCSGFGTAAAMTAAIGAGIGVGIDALFGPRTVYRSESNPSPVVRLAPMLSKDRKGLSAAIVF